MRRIARSILRGNSDVDDVVQEAWLRTLQQDAGPQAPRAWLARVTRNLVFSHHREKQRRRAREAQASRPERVSSTGDVVAREELRRRVVRAVLALDESQRECIVARYFDDLPPREIARVLGIPVATVRSRIRRGRGALRHHLELDATGDGTHWLGGLAVLAGGGPDALSTTSEAAHVADLTGGVIAVTTKTKVALSLGLVTALSIGAYQVLLHDESDPTSTRHAEVSLLWEPSERPLDPTRARVARDSDGSGPQLARRKGPGELGTPHAAPPARGEEEGNAPEPEGPARAMHRAYERLKSVYAGDGWLAVKKRIASLRTLLGTKEGVTEFLGLLDAEKDAYFLEALFHHLARPDGGHVALEQLVANEALHKELWERFEREADPLRRASYLSFFNQNPRLRGKKMAQFLSLAASDPMPRVRAASVEALRGVAERRDVWPVLCEVAEKDPDDGCRAVAVRGLSKVETGRAQNIVRSAFTSASEELRTAAWESSTKPPRSIVGSDAASYLRSEFRSARTNAYKSAILDHLVEVSAPALKEELEMALHAEPNGSARRYYQAVLDILAGGGVEDRWDVRRHAKQLFVRFRYGGQ